MVIMQEIKIGVVASMLMLEIVAYYSKQNKDLFDVLEDIYNKYGYYIEKGESIVLKGIEGKEKIKEKMDSLRNTIITEIEGVKVLKTRDYEKIEEQKSNDMYYEVCADKKEDAITIMDKLKRFIKL